VVGDDVEEQAHAVLAQRGDHGLELSFGADLGVQGVVVHDVVAVRAAGPRLRERRSVQVPDPKPREIRY
jgi:hypothetical protein